MKQSSVVLSLVANRVNMDKVASYISQSVTTGTGVRFDVDRVTDSLIKIEMERPSDKYRSLYAIIPFVQFVAFKNRF